jgi:hypothetical protein
MYLMELLVQAMEEDSRANVGNLDNYLMGFWEGDDDMDAEKLPSVESKNPIDDIDLSFREEDTFDLMGTLLPLMVVYREYLQDDLQTNVVFNSQHLRIALLSDVECVDNFCF